MTDPRVETIERFWRALNEGDDAALAGQMAPEIILDWSRSRAPYAGVIHGHAGALGFLPTLLDPFGETRHAHSKPELLPGDQALVEARLQATGRGSGVAIEARGAFLIDFSGTLISRMAVFQSVAEAWGHVRRERLASARLYFVCEGRPGSGDPEPLLEAALDGGVDVIQLREKAPRCAEEMIALAEPFRKAASAHGALFFVNDDPELVGQCDADGVHLGQDDAPVSAARGVCGPGGLIGLSTHTTAQFDAAIAAEGPARPDQVSVGPVWATPTKPGRPAAGLEVIAHASAHGGDIPWFAIGGIDTDNIGEVAAAGAARAVVVRAIRDAADPRAAAQAILEALDG